LYYYEVALSNYPLEPLTYKSENKLNVYIQVEVKLRNRKEIGTVLKEVEEPSFKCIDVQEVLPFTLNKETVSIANFMAQYYFCSIGEALAQFVPASVNSTDVTVKNLSTQIKLSEKQQEAYEFCSKRSVSLIFGDTGSGKTEIYMKLFERMLSEGKRSIFLVPEISLTPQMQKRLEAHFGEHVALWHSKITKKKKEKILERIRSGEVFIIAGPRSALFLPIENLGLIVVDEEHDDSYKAGSRPRYHARDMALLMGAKQSVKVVLGSATPSLSSYEKFDTFRLRGGFYNSARRFVFQNSTDSITPEIEEAIDNVVESKKQALVFLPTRANFKYLYCDDCGHTHSCVFCSVGMSLHRHTNSVRCHYCGYTEPVPHVCSKCGSEILKTSRLGTAEVVRYFKEQKQNIRVAQFDKDTITTQKKLVTLLDTFNRGEIDLLVGTQMLSKGHDYHDISLSVILGIDNILGMADFRARERALSLVVQIAGRSGRSDDSNVIIQTSNSEFFAAYLDDYELFLKDELEFRKELYPPYKHFARILFAHAKVESARGDMEQMLQNLNSFKDVEVVGAGVAAIERIANKSRFYILLRAGKRTKLLSAISSTKTALAEVDIDPIDFV